VVRCPNCGAEGPDQARFCRACGVGIPGDGGSQAYTSAKLTAEERARRLLEEAFRLSEQGTYQSAAQACQQAIALNPMSTSAHSLLATLYERVGDRDGAIREYEQVLTLDPGSTAERRRLNELMGVPSAPAPVRVSARTTRVAATGGFVVVALVLLAAILFTTQQAERPARREGVGPAPRATRQEVAQAAAPSDFAPSRLRRLGQMSAPMPIAQRRVAQRPAPAPRPTGDALGQWLGPYMLPAGGRERFVGLASERATGSRRYAAATMQSAVPLQAGAGPTVRTPQWRRLLGPGGRVGAAARHRLARDRYFAGDYQGAIRSYQTYLVQHPNAAAPREELAWVYAEAGRHGAASEQYRIALDQNRNDIQRGHNVEAAQHGVRTCESAIKAFDTQQTR
jgi:Tfp pilus assembly protein PilF